MTAPVLLNARRELFVDRFLVERPGGSALHPRRREIRKGKKP
ncbi:MAG: hypothetical protein OXH50_13105 [Gemmatimonadetes bacterium]|nr:hypothetical protein [Gemmatimonadota bacterium]